MKRFHDWPQRLSRFFDCAARAQFFYGSMDCCKFACAAIEAQTGTNPAPAIEYAGRQQAAKVLRSMGGFRQMSDSIAEEHGFKKLDNPKLAQRGDLVRVIHDGKLALGIVGLRGDIAVMKSLNGLISLPMSQAEAAWRV